MERPGIHPHVADRLTRQEKTMNITIDDILARYGKEIATLTQRMILAEARADAAEARLAEQGDPEA